MRILIADDERDRLMNLGILLRSEGFHVELVEHDAAVAKAVRDFRPDAVVLDLQARCAVAESLKKELGHACPVLISVNTKREDQPENSCAIAHYVPEPYDRDALIGLLASLKSNS